MLVKENIMNNLKTTTQEDINKIFSELVNAPRKFNSKLFFQLDGGVDLICLDDRLKNRSYFRDFLTDDLYIVSACFDLNCVKATDNPVTKEKITKAFECNDLLDTCGIIGSWGGKRSTDNRAIWYVYALTLDELKQLFICAGCDHLQLVCKRGKETKQLVNDYLSECSKVIIN